MNHKSTCLGCTKRYIGCHSTCEEYIQYAKRREEIRNKCQDRRDMENLFRTMIRDGCDKNRRKYGK